MTISDEHIILIGIIALVICAACALAFLFRIEKEKGKNQKKKVEFFSLLAAVSWIFSGIFLGEILAAIYDREYIVLFYINGVVTTAVLISFIYALLRIHVKKDQ